MAGLGELPRIFDGLLRVRISDNQSTGKSSLGSPTLGLDLEWQAGATLVEAPKLTLFPTK